MSYAPFTIAVGDRRLGVTGDSALAALAPAFAGVIDDSDGDLDAVLEVETLDDPAGRAPWRDCAPGAYRSGDGGLAFIHHEPSSVETFQPGEGRESAASRLHLRATPDALASGELRAHPANYAIASWLAGPGRQLIHGAAVAINGRGVLFVGVGGQGKSTLALACALAGFSFLGDDLCVVDTRRDEPGVPARVHGLYATAKLNTDSRERLHAHDWPILGVTSQGKEAIALPPGIHFERSAPLVAVVAIRPGSPHDGLVRPVPAAEAVGLLAPTALPMALGSGTAADWLRTAASIAREVPAYELARSWDLDRVVSEVRSLVERDLPAHSGNGQR